MRVTHYEPGNVHLQLSIFPLKPHFRMNGTKILGGLIGDTILSIFPRLNFTYDVLLPDQVTAGTKLANGTWIGAFKYIAEDAADLFPGPVTPSMDRLAHGYVSVAFIESKLCTITGRPIGGNGGILTFIAAFSWEVWLGILLMLLLVAVLESFFERDTASMGYRIFQAMGNLLMESSMKEAKRQPTRVLVAFWWMVVLVTANSFAGHLRALMMLRPKPNKLNGFSDMVRTGVDFYSWTGSFAEYLLMNAVNPDAQKLWQRVEERGTSVNLQTMFSRKSVHKAALGKVILLCERHCAEYYISKMCGEFSEIGEFYFPRAGDIYNYPSAMFYNNRLPRWIADQVDHLLRMYFESGLDTKSVHSEFYKCEGDRNDDSNNFKTLGMSDLGGVFLMLGFFLGLALVAFAFENVKRLRKVAKVLPKASLKKQHIFNTYLIAKRATTKMPMYLKK